VWQQVNRWRLAQLPTGLGSNEESIRPKRNLKRCDRLLTSADSSIP
jgi:hypothetical protein